jgi:prevent-host-death family protein
MYDSGLAKDPDELEVSVRGTRITSWSLAAPSPDSETISMSDARDRLGDLVSRAVHTREPVYLSRRGRRIAAVIDTDTLDRLIELAEDAIDAAEANTARAELADGAEPVPWDEVKRDLGL